MNVRDYYEAKNGLDKGNFGPAALQVLETLNRIAENLGTIADQLKTLGDRSFGSARNDKAAGNARHYEGGAAWESGRQSAVPAAAFTSQRDGCRNCKHRTAVPMDEFVHLECGLDGAVVGSCFKCESWEKDEGNG